MTKHRGPGISINGSGGTSHINDWKMKMTAVSEGLPVVPFKPLVVKPHPRQNDIDAFKAIPSLIR